MQFDQLRRRDFITLFGGAAAWPLAARGQQPARMWRIGFLHFGSPGPFVSQVAAFEQGLKEAGYVGGENVAIEYLWAENQRDRLPAVAADLACHASAHGGRVGGLDYRPTPDSVVGLA